MELGLDRRKDDAEDDDGEDGGEKQAGEDREAIRTLLTRSIKLENLIKQKARQGAVPYLWGVTFQLLKQYLAKLDGRQLRRVLRELKAESPFQELAGACYTQICLQCKDVADVPKLWGGRSIHDYLLGIWLHREGISSEDADTLFSVSGYTAAVAETLNLKAAFTPKNFVEQWGSSHQAWPVQKKYLHGKDRLGFPLPGSLVAAHREYYVLPHALPPTAMVKWGGLRLLVSKVTLADCLGDDTLTGAVARTEIHFVYFTDSHYGDDDEYQDLNVPGHVGTKPYYLLGNLELLLLAQFATKGYHLRGQQSRLKDAAAVFLDRLLVTLEKQESLYCHATPAFVQNLLGCNAGTLQAIFGNTIYSGWLLRACAPGRALLNAKVEVMLSVDAECPVCRESIDPVRQNLAPLDAVDGTRVAIHRACVGRLKCGLCTAPVNDAGEVYGRVGTTGVLSTWHRACWDKL